MEVGTIIHTGDEVGEYAVLTPILDSFEMYADDTPTLLSEEVRISLYIKGNYLGVKNQVVRKLLQNSFTITDMQYIELEKDTNYHHYNIDVKKINKYEMENN